MRRILSFAIIVVLLETALFLITVAKGSEYDRGKNLYENRCQMCHGADGKGNGPAASAFSPKPENFTDPKFWQRKDIDNFITNTVEKGHGMMPAFNLKPDENRAIIDYLSHTFKKG